ncbi:SPW repeat domain-containing protein [Hymenobacter sp. HD11105]|jgi:hypothetical protein
MKILSPVAHGVIDIGFITALAMAPIVLDLVPAVDTACFVMAGGYLLLTLMTDFRYGLIKLVPYPVHGWLDLLTGVALVAAPFVLGFESGSAERNLFLFLGIVSIVVWFLTDWRAQTRTMMTDRNT